MSENDTTDDTTEEQFSIAQTGPLHYTVKSTRSGQRAHRVNIQTLECSCEDMTYSRGLTSGADGGRDICDHLAHVLDVHPQLDASESAVYQAMSLMDGARNLYSELEDQREQLEESIVQLRDAQAGLEASNSAGSESSADGSAATDSTDDSPPGGMTEADVEKAADDLQEAFDDVIDDMQVQHNDGLVWFQTGRDTPDDWPFPGGDETFSVVTAPDCVMFVHDGSADWADSPHKHYESKPGEWWKNALDPQDVDEYVEEVLE